MAKNKATPIMENEHVKELLGIMEANNLSTMKDLLDVIGQVTAMENQLGAAVNELQSMRRELAEAQAQNHPVKTAMQNAVIAMQGQVLDLRNKLAELKQNVIDGCKNAVTAFKEKGISALDNIARFFKVKPILENMRDTLNDNIKFDDKAIAKIEAVSAEYHEAGRHIKNMGRTLVGKEAVSEAKAPGRMAKSVAGPFRAERSCFVSMKKSVETAIGKMERLEERAAERKPSIKKTMQELNAKIAQTQKSAPAPERPRPVSHDGR
jgi:DNA repair exonuclease SbcCD ATPase subunit